ncbi:MAG TPA: glycolate oxidase subunit GlcE [Rhodobacteraceae bacterium]|nr:glycolate oxidase subunit GlcE [Paracoccaceae bacterium]
MLQPKTEADLAALIAGRTAPLRIIGGGTRDVGAPVKGEVLSLRGLSGIVDYEPGAMTLVVKAGTSLAEVDAALAQEGQRLAFEPADWRALLGTTGEPTVGGMVAANVSGPRRVAVGACRDFLLGLRFVDGRGRVLKNGGRVMKNVTGYDLVKLMAGSWGSLGAMTEASFKVLAKPAAEVTLVKSGLSAQDGVHALTQALGTPYDVSGAAWVGVGRQGEARVRLEGLPGSVAYRREALLNVLGAGWDAVSAEPSAALWREVRDVTPFVGRAGTVWRVSVKPTDGPRLLEALGAEEALLDWGGGLVWLLMPEGQDGGEAAVRAALRPLGGHATLMRGAAELRSRIAVFQPEAPAVATLAAAIRREFDPNSIFNAGIMG